MGKNRFVVRKTKRIDISDGDWIEVKEQLNIGELLEVEGAGIEISKRPGETEATYKFTRPGHAAVTRLAIWLTGWSLCDSAGKKVVLSRDGVGRLDEDTFGEIREALDKHEKDMGGDSDSSDSDKSGKEEGSPN